MARSGWTCVVTRMVQVYKSKVLSFVEYRTLQCRYILSGIDAIQKRFLRECSHRSRRARVLQPGSAGHTTRYCIAGPDSPGGSWMRPETLREHVPLEHHRLCWHLQSHRGSRNLQKLVRSTLGLTDVYNLLPARVVEQKSIAAMQHELQCLLKFRGWQHTFSPRVSLSEHPLHHVSAAALVPHDVEFVSLRSASIAWDTITGAVGFLRWTLRKTAMAKAPPAVTPQARSAGGRQRAEPLVRL